MAEPLKLDPPEKYPEELAAAAAEAGARLAALGVAHDDALTIGWELSEHLRRHWGGRQIYLLKQEHRPDPRQMGLLDSTDHAGGLNANEMLLDIAEQVEERLVATGTDHAEAQRIGWEVARALNALWGGGSLYLPKGVSYETSLLHQEIYRRFNGDNHDWLAQQYGLTVQAVYRIIKRVGSAERAKRQTALF